MKTGTPGPWTWDNKEQNVKSGNLIVAMVNRVDLMARPPGETNINGQNIAKAWLLPEIQEWVWRAKGYLEELVDRGQGCDYARDIIKGLEETLAKLKEG